MPYRNSPGVYKKTAAFAFLKEQLCVSKGVPINKQFFLLFFEEIDPGFYLIKKPEEVIQDIFTKSEIPTLNKNYFVLKKAARIDEAQKISKQIMQTAIDELQLAA
jgi:hypothetical protein